MFLSKVKSFALVLCLLGCLALGGVGTIALARQRAGGPGSETIPTKAAKPDAPPAADAKDVEIDRETMFTLINGLLRRCRKGVFLGLSELDEHGYEPKGPLLEVIQSVLQTSA